MHTLTIEMTSKTGDFINLLEEIKTKLESGFNSCFDKNSDEDYFFKVI